MIQFDQKQGNRARYTANGWEVTEVAFVSGLSGVSQGELISSAVSQPGVPTLGSRHPTYLAARLESISPELLGGGRARLTLEYRQRGLTDEEGNPQPSVRGGATVNSAETNIDRFGNTIFVEFQGEKQGGEVQFLKPEVTLNISRQEAQAPGQKAKDYVGKVNKPDWVLDPVAASGQWLCSGLNGESNDGGASYRVDYDFQYAGSGNDWTHEVVYIDPATGRPPAGVAAGSGVSRWEVYEYRNFNNLNLGSGIM